MRERLIQLVAAAICVACFAVGPASARSAHELVFTRHDGLSGAGKTLVAWIERARFHGIDLTLDPPTVDWATQADPRDRARQLDVERQLERALGRLVAELPAAPREVPIVTDPQTRFYASPDSLWRDRARPDPAPEALAAAREAALHGHLDQHLDALLPAHPQYRRLVAAAERYAAICASGGWQPIAPPRTKKRRDWVPPPAIAREYQARMQLEGLYPPPGEEPSGVWDEATRRALDVFRAARQIPRKGLDHPALIEALAVPCETRLATLLLNVRRWRVSAYRGEATFVEVNIAAQELRYVRDGRLEMSQRTIVGSPRWYFDDDLQRRINVRATPVLADRISRIVLNPIWTVPSRIARNEIDRELTKDPSYLEKKRIRVVERNGRKTYVQEPGEDNALGVIKILFPNQESIYLHDTPKKGPFTQAVRALSHGCVRVANAVDFGMRLLAHDDASFDEAKARLWIGGKGPIIYNLAAPVPVFLEYYTASVDDDGVVRFHPDIYAYDAELGADVTSR